MSTIAAVSTPLAEGGIAVIRISGENALDIAEKVFEPMSKKPVNTMFGYTCAYGKVISANSVIDDGVLTVFRAPKSYTGENIAEISCHGGVFIARKILREILDAGAVPAAAGEFTKRAFLNGKLSLTEAEAVMDVISSNGEQSLRAANAVKDGALFRRISSVSEKIMRTLGELSAWVDYPEEDIADVDNDILLSVLDESCEELEKISATYDSGRIIKNGIDTALVGKANVGKSTLMNSLLGYERSIVTDIEGTTRDVVEDSLRLGDIVLRLSDTAGIRNTSDAVEAIGVERSKKKISEADLVLVLFDNSSELDEEDRAIISEVEGTRAIAVINKTDMENRLDISFIREKLGEPVMISAKNGEGTDLLRQRIEKMFHVEHFDLSAGIIANERQKLCVERALSSFREARDVLTLGMTYDAVTVLIDEGEQALLELTGEKVTDAVIDEVFSKFCVGK